MGSSACIHWPWGAPIVSQTEHSISYQPTKGLTYDPAEDAYWDPLLLDAEIQRAFEICHGCRMCFKYCDSFPTLFDLLDNHYDGDVRRLEARDKARIADGCFQCKLCEVQCPYTPRDGHEYQLDFPKLIHRFQAVRRKEEPSRLRDRLLADPDLAGRMARMSFGLANAMNKVAVHRWFMEKLLGIHHEKLLPEFASETFDAWAEREGRIQAEPPAEVVLFQTCFVQNNEPELGRDTLEVFDRNQVGVACVKGLKCCGMPAWETGDLETLRSYATHNFDRLLPFVEQGAKVVAINPTCAMMMRKEYALLVDPSERPRAERLAEAVMDPGEFLWSIRKEERFNTEFRSSPGATVGYHAPCHLRAQAVGFKGRDLLRKIPGVTPKAVMECCGHDGTYAMKVESFERSAAVGKKAFEGLEATDAEVYVTDCPLAALQFEQHAGRRALHPMTVLRRAYREDGFPNPIPPSKEGGS